MHALRVQSLAHFYKQPLRSRLMLPTTAPGWKRGPRHDTFQISLSTAGARLRPIESTDASAALEAARATRAWGFWGFWPGLSSLCAPLTSRATVAPVKTLSLYIVVSEKFVVPIRRRTVKLGRSPVVASSLFSCPSRSLALFPLFPPSLHVLRLTTAASVRSIHACLRLANRCLKTLASFAASALHRPRCCQDSSSRPPSRSPLLLQRSASRLVQVRPKLQEAARSSTHIRRTIADCGGVTRMCYEMLGLHPMGGPSLYGR